MNEASYQEALQVSIRNQLDYHALAVALAQQAPDVLVRLLRIDLDEFASRFIQEQPDAFVTLARRQVVGLQNMTAITGFMKHGNLVGAIKELRSVKGLGLKEAKDIIVTARDALVAAGTLPAPVNHSPVTAPGSSPTLDASDQALCDAIIAAF